MNKQEAEREYRERYQPLYESLTPRIAQLISDLISDAAIPVSQIEHRVKTIQSFLGKIDRKNYAKPFDEITDFAGIRIITYYSDDVENVAKVLRNEFEVEEANSSDKVEDLGVDEFGYRSFHLVCALKKPRIELAEWKNVKGLRFEIQIRSVLQHAWAAISHKLDYKSAAQAPREVRRQLFRLSALLELADSEFASVRDRTEVLVDRYRSDVDKGDLFIPLNLDSLEQYLSERFDEAKWRGAALNAGLRPLEKTNEEILESVEQQSRERLFQTLQILGVKTLAEADALLRRHITAAKKILPRVADKSEAHGYLMYAIPLDVAAVVLSIAEKERFGSSYKKVNWASEIKAALEELAGTAKPSLKRTKRKAKPADPGDKK